MDLIPWLKKRLDPKVWIGLVLVIVVLVIGMNARLFPLMVSQAASTSAQAAPLYEKLGIAAIPRIPPPVDFLLAGPNGRNVRLSGLKGKVVMLNFWTTWCPDCRKEMPGLEKLHQAFQGRPFTLLAVDLRESPKTVRAFFDKNNLSFTALLDRDGTVARRFGIRSIPTTFLIDQEGAIIGKAVGSRPWDSRKAVALVEHLIANPPSSQRGPAKESE